MKAVSRICPKFRTRAHSPFLQPGNSLGIYGPYFPSGTPSWEGVRIACTCVHLSRNLCRNRQRGVYFFGDLCPPNSPRSTRSNACFETVYHGSTSTQEPPRLATRRFDIPFAGSDTTCLPGFPEQFISCCCGGDQPFLVLYYRGGTTSHETDQIKRPVH